MGANVACWAGQYQHAVTAAHEPHAPDLDGTAEGTPSAEHVPQGLQRYGPGSRTHTSASRWKWHLQSPPGAAGEPQGCLCYHVKYGPPRSWQLLPKLRRLATGHGSWAASLVCAPGALGGRRDVMYIVPSLAAVLGPTGQNG